MKITETDKENIVNLSKMENKEHLINYVSTLLTIVYNKGRLDGIYEEINKK